MPTPGKGETKKKFISRCIPVVIDDGTAGNSSQAAAICYSLWREKHGKKSSVYRTITEPIRKMKTSDGRTIFKCYAVRFTESGDRDWYGTYFDAETDYHPDWFRQRPWLHHHGMHHMAGSAKVGTWFSLDIDEQGVFVLGEMDERFKYLEALETLIDAKMIFPSSGTLGYVMDVDPDGHVTDWPIIEVSSTVRPADLDAGGIEPDVLRAYRTLQGGIMGEQTDVLSELGVGLPARGDTDPGEVGGSPQGDTQPQPEPVAPAPEPEPEPDNQDDGRALVDTARALQIPQIVRAISAVDSQVAALASEMAELRTMVEGLAQSEVKRVKDALGSEAWFQNLYSVGEPDGGSPTPSTTPAPEGDQVSPASVILQAQNT